MRSRGIVEKRALRSVDFINGRTEWDKAHAFFINPQASYGHNDETLRMPFYEGQWELEHCQNYRIFMSQAHYPIKGLHMLLQALPAVIADYPNAEVHIAGHDFFNNRGCKINGYGYYINRLIQKLGLSENIYFTGLLDGDEMKAQYLKAHVFVCPSAIENSPNSLGEAQMLGTPVVASWVGGIPSMVEHGVSGLLYRFEEPEHLAAHILNVFANVELCKKLAIGGREAAQMRHNPERNAHNLYKSYKLLLGL
jgi:glycosyltransferase involved in cell wall biosynthesis